MSLSFFHIYDLLADNPELMGLWLSAHEGEFLALPVLIRELAKTFIFYPVDHEYQYDLLTAYTMVYSPYNSVLPHLVAWSREPGSGKSAVPKLISSLTGHKICQGASTVTSLRNAIKQGRFENGEDSEEVTEKPFHLLFDDINERKFFNDRNLLEILKCSYSRKSEIVTIAGTEGAIIEFKTFCPKVLTSVSQFWLNSSLGELQRRILLLVHTKAPDAVALEDIDYFSFESEDEKPGFNRNLISNFWECEENLTKFRKYTRKALKECPKHLKAHNEIISILCTIFGYKLSYATEIVNNAVEKLTTTRLQQTLVEILQSKADSFLRSPSLKEIISLTGIPQDEWLNIRLVNIDKFLKFRSEVIAHELCSESSILSPQECLLSLGYSCQSGLWVLLPEDKDQ